MSNPGRSVPVDEIHDAGPGRADFPEVDAEHPAGWRLGASRNPYDVPVRTSVVSYELWVCPELFYSMLDGHPPRRRHPDPRPLLYKNPPVDALRRSVPPDDVGVSGTRDWRSQCMHTSISVCNFLSFWVLITTQRYFFSSGSDWPLTNCSAMSSCRSSGGLCG